MRRHGDKKMKFSTEMLDKVAKLTNLNYNELTQDDIIDLKSSVVKTLSSSKEVTTEEDSLVKGLYWLLDGILLRPMDQRSFPTFACSFLMEYADDQEEDEVVSEEFAYDAFYGYMVDGTLTYNTQKSLNYIRAFWEDFVEEDVALTSSEDIFSKPEAFLVNQTYYMARQVQDLFFDVCKGEELTYKDFKKFVEEHSEPFLSDHIY